jgi:hypothetical protein
MYIIVRYSLFIFCLFCSTSYSCQQSYFSLLYMVIDLVVILCMLHEQHDVTCSQKEFQQLYNTNKLL